MIVLFALAAGSSVVAIKEATTHEVVTRFGRKQLYDFGRAVNVCA